jgi:hypothetical protein
MRKVTALFAQIGFWGLATPALAGVTVTMQGKERSVVYLEGNKMRVESDKKGQPQEGFMIYDGDKQKMIILDPAKKTYSEMTPESIKAMTSAMTARMEEAKAKMSPEQRKQMDEMMAKMSPEQRKQMQGAMGGTSARAEQKPKEQIKWERTGAKQTVAGFPCEGFKELKGGKPDAEGCYIPWSAGAITKSDLAPMHKMEEFLSQSGMDASDRKFTTFSQLDQMPGFPGVWVPTSSDGPMEKQTVTDIKRGSIPADKFQLPAGYTKTDPGANTH